MSLRKQLESKVVQEIPDELDHKVARAAGGEEYHERHITEY
jgi:hypothetical protein